MEQQQHVTLRFLATNRAIVMAQTSLCNAMLQHGAFENDLIRRIKNRERQLEIEGSNCSLITAHIKPTVTETIDVAALKIRLMCELDTGAILTP